MTDSVERALIVHGPGGIPIWSSRRARIDYHDDTTFTITDLDGQEDSHHVGGLRVILDEQLREMMAIDDTALDS